MEFDQFMSQMASSPFAMMGLGVSLQTITTVFNEKPTLKYQLKKFDPVKSSALVAGLLTEPRFHANTLRIELLIKLLLCTGAGNRNLNTSDIDTWLNSVLGTAFISRMEDPIEDVFISNIATENGNIRIFEGTWESSDFYLQRVLNVVATLPHTEPSAKLRSEIASMLLLSEAIANRLGLERFSSGGGEDKGKIRIPAAPRLKALRDALTFTPDELSALGIHKDNLKVFIFSPKQRKQLGQQSFGENDLVKYPLVVDGNNLIVMLPTAISVSIRQRIFNWLVDSGFGPSFDKHLTLEYSILFGEIPVLGANLPRNIPISPIRVHDKIFFEFSREIDKGRYVHILAVVDSINGNTYQGFCTPDNDPNAISDKIDSHIKVVQQHFRKVNGFKKGLTLIVGCGYGRPSVLFTAPNDSDWMTECISAPDLFTISTLPGISSLVLWKLIEHKNYLADNKISISNVNGLLNLYGWWVESNYFIIPQEVPFPNEPAKIVIPTNSLVNVRTKARRACDIHVLPFIDGSFVRVMRTSSGSFFPSDAKEPLYGALEAAGKGELLGAYAGGQIVWWVAVDEGKSALSRDLIFRTWDAIHNWLARLVPIAERYPTKLPGNPIIIILDFNDTSADQEKSIPETELRGLLQVTTENETGIRITFNDPFFCGFRTPKNIAERSIIRAIICGFFKLTGYVFCEIDLDLIISEIVPDYDARYLHFFEANHFRDVIQSDDKPKKLYLDESDVSIHKLGIGWLDPQDKTQSIITEAMDSVTFLNKVVSFIWTRMRTQLIKLDREDFVKRALRHLEGVEADKDRWQRTIRAVLALRDDQGAAQSVALKQMAQCNASELALRLLVEMASSECPLETGIPVGKLDLIPLMCDVLMMFHLGGCSDAINKGVMEPEVKIAPCGDILTHTGFHEEVLGPMGQDFESILLTYESTQYETHFEPFVPVETVKGILNDQFLDAFEQEFGFSVDALRGFRETIEDMAVEKKLCVFVSSKSEILRACQNKGFVSGEIGEKVIEAFSLCPRSSWDTTPRGFQPVDWYPWRFGRQLSLIRRPIVRLNNSTDPMYVISPGLIGQATLLTVRRYWEADLDVNICYSTAMKQWVDAEGNRRGAEFEIKVSDKLQNLGYKVLNGKKVTHLVNDKLDMDYGDVDVLAWKEGGDEILSIECKDLKMAKTPNEIAEQLNRFAGQLLPNGDRDNLLKHIQRCEMLRDRLFDVAKIIDFPKAKSVKNIVCFSKPVPMEYVARRFPDITFITFDNLTNIQSRKL